MQIRELNLEKSGIQYHKTLNPKCWDDESQTLDPEVRAGLLRISRKFIDFVNVVGFSAQKIVLTGSMANYNWTQHSDFDLHVVTDFTKFECNLADELFMAKKSLWNNEHDITILGYDVELYVEDINKPPVSQGIYDLIENSWIKKPVFAMPKFNDAAVDAKASTLMSDIDRMLASQPADDAEYQRLSDKIWKMRQAGLDEAGEFSTENLAFKILRNLGYLDKFKKARTINLDKGLSIL